MATKLPTISDLIQRVVSSTCLTDHHYQEDDDSDDQKHQPESEEEEPPPPPPLAAPEQERQQHDDQLTSLMEEVFSSVSALKRAYVGLQRAHSPWDPDLITAADHLLVAELHKLTSLKHTFHRRHHRSSSSIPSFPLSDAVAPYEVALLDARREIAVKDAEISNLKEKLRIATTPKKGRSSRRPSAVLRPYSGFAPATPTAEVFSASAEEVTSASKAFSNHIISLMRLAKWDVDAAVRILFSGAGAGAGMDTHHARYAVESYINEKIFEGFEHESFYMEGSLSSLLNPSDHQHRCFSQFSDMKGMDPGELLGVLPTCSFGNWAAKKYLSIISGELEEALVGSKECRRRVAGGAHPRTGLYGEFLRVAKAVWLLHLLAFSMDSGKPTMFRAGKGVEFEEGFMESVVRFPGGHVPAGWVVGFGVGVGFKLGGNNNIIRARVYPVPKDH